jgi:hypothetical protein
MRITTAILCSAVAARIVTAQSTSAPAPSAKPGTVDGVVTNSVSSEPVRKAVVTLQSQVHGFAYQAVTDAAGHFHFDNVDPGSYSVGAVREGYAGQTPGRRRNEKRVTVAEEQNVADVAVALAPLAQVGGRVLDEGGDPIALANVMALRASYHDGNKRLMQASIVRSNDLGEFQFVNLEAGRYYFRVSAPQRPANLPPRTRMTHPEEAYPATYYPNAAAPRQATAVNVAPGADMNGVDFRMHKKPAYHIRGKVNGQTGQPERNVMIQLESPDLDSFSGGGVAAEVQPDGAFDFRAIVSGSYVVVARDFTHNVTMFARQPIQVADQDVSVVLAPLPGFEISGRISVEGPAPAQMHARLAMNAERPGDGSVQAEVAGDGTFRFENVMQEIYRISVVPGAPGLYVKSIRLGDQDVSDGLVNLSQGGGGSLNIFCGTDGSQVQGSVESASGEPAPGAWVTLAPTGQNENRTDLIKQANTDQYGHFKLQDLAPGDYQVFAWGDPDVDYGLIHNADFLKSLSSQAASVSLGPNGSESVQLKVISADDMEQAENRLP